MGRLFFRSSRPFSSNKFLFKSTLAVLLLASSVLFFSTSAFANFEQRIACTQRGAPVLFATARTTLDRSTGKVTVRWSGDGLQYIGYRITAYKNGSRHSSNTEVHDTQNSNSFELPGTYTENQYGNLVVYIGGVFSESLPIVDVDIPVICPALEVVRMAPDTAIEISQSSRSNYNRSEICNVDDRSTRLEESFVVEYNDQKNGVDIQFDAQGFHSYWVGTSAPGDGEQLQNRRRVGRFGNMSRIELNTFSTPGDYDQVRLFIPYESGRFDARDFRLRAWVRNGSRVESCGPLAYANGAMDGEIEDSESAGSTESADNGNGSTDESDGSDQSEFEELCQTQAYLTVFQNITDSRKGHISYPKYNTFFGHSGYDISFVYQGQSTEYYFDLESRLNEGPVDDYGNWRSDSISLDEAPFSTEAVRPDHFRQMTVAIRPRVGDRQCPTDSIYSVRFHGNSQFGRSIEERFDALDAGDLLEYDGIKWEKEDNGGICRLTDEQRDHIGDLPIRETFRDLQDLRLVLFRNGIFIDWDHYCPSDTDETAPISNDSASDSSAAIDDRTTDDKGSESDEQENQDDSASDGSESGNDSPRVRFDALNPGDLLEYDGLTWEKEASDRICRSSMKSDHAPSFILDKNAGIDQLSFIGIDWQHDCDSSRQITTAPTAPDTDTGRDGDRDGNGDGDKIGSCQLYDNGKTAQLRWRNVVDAPGDIYFRNSAETLHSEENGPEYWYRHHSSLEGAEFRVIPDVNGGIREYEIIIKCN